MTEASVHRPTRVERIRGCLLAGAMGDALGAAVEFDSLAQIRAHHGPAGITGYAVAYGRRGAITDDTQMTLFTAEGLIRAHARLRSKGICHKPSVVHHAYMRWLHTQGLPWSEAGRPYGGAMRPPDGWLVGERVLHRRRAPGDTCLSALTASVAGAEQGSVEHPPNDSKGCGGVMRAAPAGFVRGDLHEVFALGCDVAALTHGHPSGYLPAGVLAAMVAQLLDGVDLPTALERSLAELRRWNGSEETLSALDAAFELAGRGRPAPEAIEGLGGGWVGEEALAIALCAALVAEDVVDGLKLAVNHSGDSDSTGAICGNLLGALWGAAALPADWVDDLEGHDLIAALAEDAALEFGDAPPAQRLPEDLPPSVGGDDIPESWARRYPPW